MNRIIAALMAALICMVGVFAACSNKDSGTSGTEGPTQNPTETNMAVTEPASSDATQIPDNTDVSASDTPVQTPSAGATASPDETEDGSTAIEDGGDIIITVPSGQASGGIGDNP